MEWWLRDSVEFDNLFLTAVSSLFSVAMAALSVDNSLLCISTRH